jgi:nifR3 family TIM-barrel protein
MNPIIANLTKQKIWLAPLAGFTDNAFRTICKKCGADVVVSEMVSVDGLIHNKEKSLKYLDFTDFQRPYGIQLFGSDPVIMAKGAEIALAEKPDFIDVNMGCPVKKVVKRGAGSALMISPELAENIIKEIKNVTSGTSIPLSVKIRAGWDNFNINAVEFGKRMENAGCDIMCLHPRTRSQMFSGQSDWSLIKKLKEKLTIPLIGNGDINSIEDIIRMFNETGCDSVMIGRGVLGKPWILRNIKEYFKSGGISDISWLEKMEIIKEHFMLEIKNKGETKALIEMRNHFSHYTKGLPDGAKVREFINRSLDSKDVLEAVETLFLSQEKAAHG